MAYATDIEGSAEPALVKMAHLDDAHQGDIIGAFGTIARNDTTHRLRWKHRLTDAARHPRPRPDRHGRRQRRRRLRRPTRQAGQNYGTTLLWTLAAADPGALRQPGDGAAARRGDRRRPCAADLRALRQVLGRVQRHRSVPAQRADHRHRVHRHRARARLSRAAARSSGVVRRRRCSSWPRSAPATSAASSASPMVLVLRAACCSCRSLSWSIRRSPRWRTTSSFRNCPQDGKLSDVMLLDHRHRRHHGRALAAVLPAELRHRQAHHAALHHATSGSICGSASRS